MTLKNKKTKNAPNSPLYFNIMKKSLIFPALIISSLIPAHGAGHAVRDMSPYVFPENVPAAPAEYTWLSDGETYATLSADGHSIVRCDIKTGKEIDVIFDVANTRENQIGFIEGFSLSEDGTKLLVWNSREMIYRRSFKASYYTYDTHSRILRPLSGKFDKQQAPLFSPDGRMVAFVVDNNIYIRKLDYQTEVAVTEDGLKNGIINGVPDWTYEEEFNTVCSMAWAPDNATLCYLSYDETAVPTYDMTLYGGACKPVENAAMYPRTWSYKYPEAGFPNSKVSLHSYDVDNRKVKDITLPDPRIEYMPRIAYGPDAETLVVATLNRDQNHFEIYRVNPKSTVAKSIYNEDSKSWIEPVSYEGLYLAPDYFVVNSWKSGYSQLYQYSYAGAEMRRLTTAEADVKEYYGADVQGNHYYQVCSPTPLDRTVVRLDKKGVTTVVSEKSGSSSADFSPGCKYMMLKYSDTTTPPVYTVRENSGKSLHTVQDNAAFRAKVGSKLAEREFFTMNSEGNTLNGYIIKPAGFNASKKYPVVMYQYSGPESQEVLNRWQFDWQDCFSAAGYVVICVDGRGTGGRGRSFCDIVYRRLGYYETIDQIAAARYAASLPYVDPSRIGIFGWSYGGYEALMCATDKDSPYAACVAIAPVTDWKLYDSVYTERYMLTPQQNDEGYRLSAPLMRSNSLRCPLLMMYGTSDDNVHPANTLEFVSRLQLAGTLCDMLVFPNMNHSINYCNARAVVYAKMLDWFYKNM